MQRLLKSYKTEGLYKAIASLKALKVYCLLQNCLYDVKFAVFDDYFGVS